MLCTDMRGVVMLSIFVFMSVFVLSVITPGDVMLNVIPSVIMLSVVRLSVFMLSVI